MLVSMLETFNLSLKQDNSLFDVPVPCNPKLYQGRYDLWNKTFVDSCPPAKIYYF